MDCEFWVKVTICKKPRGNIPRALHILFDYGILILEHCIEDALAHGLKHH